MDGLGLDDLGVCPEQSVELSRTFYPSKETSVVMVKCELMNQSRPWSPDRSTLFEKVQWLPYAVPWSVTTIITGLIVTDAPSVTILG